MKRMSFTQQDSVLGFEYWPIGI